jgi:hypothetical protein
MGRYVLNFFWRLLLGLDMLSLGGLGLRPFGEAGRARRLLLAAVPILEVQGLPDLMLISASAWLVV